MKLKLFCFRNVGMDKFLFVRRNCSFVGYYEWFEKVKYFLFVLVKGFGVSYVDSGEVFYYCIVDM